VKNLRWLMQSYRPQGLKFVLSLTSIFAIQYTLFSIVYSRGEGNSLGINIVYITIVFGTLFFGLKGGLFFAVTGIMFFSPFIFSDAYLGNSSIWVYRIFFFFVTALFFGKVFDEIFSMLKNIEFKSYLNDVNTVSLNTSLLGLSIYK